MLSRIQIYAVGAIGIAALIAWGSYQMVRISNLKSENAALSTSLTQSKADANQLRVTIAAQERRMERMAEEARKADAIRQEIEDLNDDTMAPDWLRSLPDRLRF